MGKVVSIDKRGSMITIDHQEIPGLMNAMTMSFMLKAEWAFDVIKPGDQISVALVVEGDRSWLEEPTITRSEGNVKASDGAAAAAAVVHGPGDQLPNFTLVNQDGKAISTERYRGQVVLLTFIYTRCPLPDYCILMNNNFAEINDQLAARPDLRAKTQLLSITIDPQYDTPQILREHGLALFKSDPKKFKEWEFATGSAEEIQIIANYFGLQYIQENDQIIHSLRTAVIRPDGKIYKVYHGNQWTTAQVLRDIESALATIASDKTSGS
ncbi:MAG: SCO family protein [Pyrinomonadaceae bacterium]